MASASDRKLSDNWGGVETYAKATPRITGIKLRILRVLNLLPNIIVDSMRVKIGVAARTTWWN